MDANKDKRILVGGFTYIIDEKAGPDFGAIVATVTNALNNKTVVPVPVRDEQGNELTLYLNGGQVDALVIDPGDEPRPGEFAP